MLRVIRFYNFSLQLLLAIFPLSTAWIYFEPIIGGVKWQYGTLLWYASEVVLAVCVLSCCLYLYTKHIHGSAIKFSWSKDRLFVLSLALFCLYLYIRSIFTLYPDIAFQQSVHVLEAILFFFCISLSPLENYKLIRALVFGAVIQSIFGIAQFLLQTTWSSVWLGTSLHLSAEAGSSVVVTNSERWLRAYGTFSHPNVFGGYLVLVLLVALQHYNTTAQKHITPVFWSTIVNIMCMVLLTMGVFVSFSRSAWIALFLGLLFLSFRPKRPEGVKWRNRFFTTLSQNEVKGSTVTPKGSLFVRQAGLGLARDDKNNTFQSLLVVISVCTFVIFSLLLWPLITTRLGATSANEHVSITERVSGSREAVGIIQDNFMFGIGPGQYTASLMQKDSSHPIWYYQPVHNVFLLVISEIGIVGIFLFFVCVLFFVSLFYLRLSDLFFFVPFIPLLIFDHYIWSSLVGLFVLVVFVSLVVRLGKPGR